MAAAGKVDGKFTSIVNQFFEMVPLRRMKWQSEELSVDDVGIHRQQEILSLTVNSELCKKYPPSLQYQKAFFKKLLSVLEEYGVEICDEVYETYTSLLQQKDHEEDSLCYRTYTLSDDERITIQESVSMISFGTTGLCTWQAAQHLAEWAIEHASLLENRDIIELGSGLGMLGLTVCRKCSVHRYTFTDCHHHVLNLLANNVQINTQSNNTDYIVQTQCIKRARRSYEDDVHTDQSETGDKQPQSIKNSRVSSEFSELSCKSEISSSNDKSETVKSGSNVSTDTTTEGLHLNDDSWKQVTDGLYESRHNRKMCVCKLDWEHLTDKQISQFGNTDVILAADVVYDTVIIAPLVKVLKQFLCEVRKEGREAAVAYIASTIRNEDTRDHFLIALSSEGLLYQPLEPPTLKLFHYDTSVPIEIIKVTAATGS